MVIADNKVMLAEQFFAKIKFIFITRIITGNIFNRKSKFNQCLFDMSAKIIVNKEAVFVFFTFNKRLNFFASVDFLDIVWIF